jgi:NitT/TauT family transport system ATP-binding protein
MVRWGQTAISPPALATARAVFRPDIYDAALGLRGDPGQAAADTIGAFTGPAFDPADVAGYLAAFEIGRRNG